MYVLELIKDMNEKQSKVLNCNNVAMFQMCRQRIAVDFPVLSCAFKLHEPFLTLLLCLSQLKCLTSPDSNV